MASFSTPVLLAEIMSKGKRMTYEELYRYNSSIESLFLYCLFNLYAC